MFERLVVPAGLLPESMLDDIAALVAADRHVRAESLRRGEGPVDFGHQVARFERLGDVAEHAAAQRLHGVGDGAVRGEDQHRQ